MCVETLTGVLFWSSDLLGKPFRAAYFPFETLSGSLLLFCDLLAFCEFSFGADIIIIPAFCEFSFGPVIGLVLVFIHADPVLATCS